MITHILLVQHSISFVPTQKVTHMIRDGEKERHKNDKSKSAVVKIMQYLLQLKSIAVKIFSPHIKQKKFK